MFQDEEHAAEEILKEGVEWLEARGLLAHGCIVFGSPIEQIPAHARQFDVDLIVVGHRRRGRLARWWSDSEGATLLDDSPCSVLAACST
jgi:nucleotide-binding universal stress UspA family protein